MDIPQDPWGQAPPQDEVAQGPGPGAPDATGHAPPPFHPPDAGNPAPQGVPGPQDYAELMRSVVAIGETAFQAARAADSNRQIMENIALFLGEQREKMGDSFTSLVDRISDLSVDVSGVPIVTTQGSSGGGSIKIREPRLFTGKSTELEAFLAEVELAIHLQPALANATSAKRAEYLLYFCSQDGVVGSWIKASRASVAAAMTDEHVYAVGLSIRTARWTAGDGVSHTVGCRWEHYH